MRDFAYREDSPDTVGGPVLSRCEFENTAFDGVVKFFMKSISLSAKTYLALVLLLVLVKCFFLVFPAKYPLPDQESAFSWLTITIVSIAGLIGLVLSRRTGFPDMWDARVSNRQRFVIPAVIGLIYGVITVLVDLSNPEPVHLRLPYSILFYAYGATLLEILLRLFAVTFLVWLISNLILRGRWQTPVFWFAAVVAALYEPLPHMMSDFHSQGAIAALSDLVRGPLFIGNLAAAYLYRRGGFLAPLTMRLSFYLIWHILYGGLLTAAR